MLSLDGHTVMDYFVGLVLVIMTLQFAKVPAACAVFAVCGIALVGYTFLSDLPLGLRRIIRYPIHRALDLTVAGVLIVGPWLFGYRQRIDGGGLAFHVGVGLFLLAVVGLTNSSHQQTWLTQAEADLRFKQRKKS